MKRILVDAPRCLGCHTCELACAVAHSKTRTLFGAVLAGERPPVAVDVLQHASTRFPLQCRHCSDAPCTKVCMAGALVRDEATGGVLCIEERCIGCMMCAMVCPFGAVGESPSHKAVKCDLCAHTGEGVPSCVAACPTGALSFEEVEGFSDRRRRAFVVNYQE